MITHIIIQRIIIVVIIVNIIMIIVHIIFIIIKIIATIGIIGIRIDALAWSNSRSDPFNNFNTKMYLKV